MSSLGIIYIRDDQKVILKYNRNKSCYAIDGKQHELEAERPSCSLLVGMVLLLHTLQALS